MKRFTMIFVVVLLAITSVFAAQNNTEAKAQVVLNLKPSDLNAYRVGFASDVSGEWVNDKENIDNLPKSTVTEIKFKSEDFHRETASSVNASTYVFYKARTTTDVILTMKADGPFVNTSDTNKKIDYTVEMTGSTSNTKVSTSTNSSWVEKVAVDESKNFVAGSFLMTVSTSAISAGYEGSYSSNLTLQIQAV